jgi:nitrogen regulatory protein P-II 1
MKRIEAIIPQSKMSDAFSALKELNIGGFTYYDSKGRGLNPPAAVHSGRGTSLYTPEFNPNLTIFSVVEDSLVEQVVNKLLASTSTGLAGEGKIFISDVDQTIDIGTKSIDKP